MDTFSDYWQQLDRDDITLKLNSKTNADVEAALNRHTLTLDDFMALIRTYGSTRSATYSTTFW